MTKYVRIRFYFSIALVAIISLGGLFFTFRKNDSKLVVSFFDIGQGDSIYIKSPSGLEMLIDTGADKTVVQRLGSQMKPFDRTIDVLLLTHPDKDHIGGAPAVLSRYDVSLLIESGATSENGVYDEVNRIFSIKANHKNIVRREAFVGQKIDLGSGVVFTVLYPNRDINGFDTNDTSIVGLLTYGAHSILLTGDAGYMIERSILNQLPNDLTVLKAGHHGSETSTSFELLEKTTPEVTVLSLGKDNSYGHPHKKVTDYLQLFKSRVYRTDTDGTIMFISDGENFDIRTNK